MTTYKGPAELLREDGRKFDTEADLTADSSGGWRGTLTFRDSTMVQELQRILDGHVLVGRQSGEVVRQSVDEWSPATGGPFVMHVWGVGPAPF